MAKSLYSIHIEDNIDRNNPFSTDLPLLDEDGDHVVREVEYKDPRGLYVQNTTEIAVYINGRFNKMRTEGVRKYIKDDVDMFGIVDHAAGFEEKIIADWSLARGSQSIYKDGMDMGNATPGAVDVAVEHELEYQKSIENEEEPVEDLDKLQEIPGSEEVEEEIIEDLDKLEAVPGSEEVEEEIIEDLDKLEEVPEEELKREEAERKAKEEAERKAKEEAEKKAKEEAEKKAKEEAERKAKEEAERKAKEEAEKKAKEEAERKAKEEAERKAKEEAEKKAKEEAERKAKEEAERKAKEEAERKAKEEAERKAKEEAERKAKEEAERKAKEEAEKKEREEAERKAEEERLAKEEAEKEAEKERLAKEEAEKKSEVAKYALIAAVLATDALAYGDTLDQFKMAYETRNKKELTPEEVFFTVSDYRLVPVGNDVDITYKYPDPEKCVAWYDNWKKGLIPAAYGCTVYDEGRKKHLNAYEMDDLYRDVKNVVDERGQTRPVEIEDVYNEAKETLNDPKTESADEVVNAEPLKETEEKTEFVDFELDKAKEPELNKTEEVEQNTEVHPAKIEEESPSAELESLAKSVSESPEKLDEVAPEKLDKIETRDPETIDAINQKLDNITRLLEKNNENKYYLVSNIDIDGRAAIDMLERTGVPRDKIIISRFEDYDALDEEMSAKIANVTLGTDTKITSIGFTGMPMENCHDILSERDEITGKYKNVFTKTKTEALAESLHVEISASEKLAVSYTKGGYDAVYETAKSYNTSSRTTYSLIHETMKQAIECGDYGTIEGYDNKTIESLANDKGIEAISVETQDVDFPDGPNRGLAEVSVGATDRFGIKENIVSIPAYQIRATKTGFNVYAIDESYAMYTSRGDVAREEVTRDDIASLVKEQDKVIIKSGFDADRMQIADEFKPEQFNNNINQGIDDKEKVVKETQPTTRRKRREEV